MAALGRRIGKSVLGCNDWTEHLELQIPRLHLEERNFSVANIQNHHQSMFQLFVSYELLHAKFSMPLQAAGEDAQGSSQAAPDIRMACLHLSSPKESESAQISFARVRETLNPQTLARRWVSEEEEEAIKSFSDQSQLCPAMREF